MPTVGIWSLASSRCSHAFLYFFASIQHLPTRNRSGGVGKPMENGGLDVGNEVTIDLRLRRLSRRLSWLVPRASDRDGIEGNGARMKDESDDVQHSLEIIPPLYGDYGSGHNAPRSRSLFARRPPLRTPRDHHPPGTSLPIKPDRRLIACNHTSPLNYLPREVPIKPRLPRRWYRLSISKE